MLELSLLEGTNGFELSGVAGSSHSGYSVSEAGDVNGDGFDDLIIGARYAGFSHVVFGKAGDFSANLELSALNGTNGFTRTGAAYISVSASAGPGMSMATVSAT